MNKGPVIAIVIFVVGKIKVGVSFSFYSVISIRIRDDALVVVVQLLTKAINIIKGVKLVKRFNGSDSDSSGHGGGTGIAFSIQCHLAICYPTVYIFQAL